jgi:hypothetical protein
MYTNILLDIENTLGKISGVSGAREGQIQSRQAVGNVEREVAQTSHITEKYFALDANFRKRALTKFLDVCKYAYKANPKKGQYMLDDMGTEMIQFFDEFCASDIQDSRKYDQEVDLDTNGIKDTLDLRRTDIDENYKNNQIRLKEQEIVEKERNNKAKESIAKSKTTTV